MTAHPATASLTIPRVARGAQATGLAAALGSALAFSSSGPVVKPLLAEGWSLGAVLLIRMAGAALVLSPVLVLAFRRRGRVLLRHWRLFVGVGLAGVAGTQLFYFAAMQRMPVAVALLIQFLAPVLLVFVAWARTRLAPTRTVLAGSLAAVVGLVFVVDLAGASIDGAGVLFALGATVSMAIYFLLCDRAGADVPPLTLAAGGVAVGAVVMSVLVVTGILPFVAADVSVPLAGVSVPWWAALAWVACVATPLGYALSVVGVHRLGSRVASFAGLSEVLFALLFAWLLLGEAPAAVQILGGAFIVVGVVLVRADASAALDPAHGGVRRGTRSARRAAERGSALRAPRVPGP